MTHAMWDRRIRRANELTSSCSFAAEGLRFYSRVATFQSSLYGLSQIPRRFLPIALCEAN